MVFIKWSVIDDEIVIKKPNLAVLHYCSNLPVRYIFGVNTWHMFVQLVRLVVEVLLTILQADQISYRERYKKKNRALAEQLIDERVAVQPPYCSSRLPKADLRKQTFNGKVLKKVDNVCFKPGFSSDTHTIK